jgi:predicted phage-related endonuclease
MKNTTLTPDQLKRRKSGIGGTDAKKIMDGDWRELWEEKTERRESMDLTDTFKVQLGINTEEFNLQWLTKVTGWNLQYHHGKTFYHPEHTFMLCHPDALATDIAHVNMVIDAKHLGPYAPWNNEEIVTQRYFWQAQHNMLVLERPCFILSCIWGNEWRDYLIIKADPSQQKLLIEREKAFWWHVEDDSLPASDPTIIEAPIVPMDDMRTVDMEGNNEWCSDAVSFLDNKVGAKKFDDAKKQLKTKIETDVKHAFGHGVEGVRAKNGNITIRPIKEKKQ